MEHWCLAVDKVRYVGEPVAVVVAEDRYLAEDALELIEVDYEPLAGGGRHRVGNRAGRADPARGESARTWSAIAASRTAIPMLPLRRRRTAFA